MKRKCKGRIGGGNLKPQMGGAGRRVSDVLTTATGNTKTTSSLRQSYHLLVGSASKEMAMTHAAHTSTVLAENRNSCDRRSLCRELTKQQPAKDWSKSKFVTVERFLPCTRNVISVTHTPLIAFKTTSSVLRLHCEGPFVRLKSLCSVGLEKFFAGNCSRGVAAGGESRQRLM